MTFTDTSVGGITNSFWAFGDGSTTNFGRPTNIAHQYQVSGVYTAMLVAAGDCFGGLSSNSLVITITSGADPFTSWQTSYFGAGPNGAPGADPLGKGFSNTNQFLLGLNPTNAASMFRVISVVRQGGINTVTWRTSGGDPNGLTAITNVVQGAVGTASGGYSNNFSDISGPLVITPIGDTTTNWPDAGGTNKYYRIRLGP